MTIRAFAAVDQPLFSAVGVVDESVVIEAEKLQDGRLEVVGGHHIFDRAVTDFVGGSIGHAPLDPASREPGREPLAVVVATGGRIGITLGDRQAGRSLRPSGRGWCRAARAA